MVENGQVETGQAKSVPDVSFARREGSSFGVEAITLRELRRRGLDHSIYRPHRVDFHAVIAITGGNGSHMVDFLRHKLERRSLVHASPGQIQSFDRAPELEGFLLLFEPEVGAPEPPSFRWPESFRFTEEDFQVLETLLSLMTGLGQRRLIVQPDRLAWRLLSAVMEICDAAANRRRAREAKPRSVEFESFDALLEQSFTRHRDLGWYARELGYSKKTLYRWSQRVVGTGAKAHIDRRVALEAKRLLVHSDLRVESIGHRLGFSESTNFVKFFKRLESATPEQFRASYARS